MVRKARNATRRRRPARTIATRRRITVTRQAQQQSTLTSNFDTLMKVARLISTAVKVTTVPDYIRLGELIFNFIASKFTATELYHGAYAMMGITPGMLVINSPLLAPVTNGFSFPGYPVSIKWIQIKLMSNLQHSERAGRWAAVLIPYREEHDNQHYDKLLEKLTYSEVVAMPHSKSASAGTPLHIKYVMRDRINYCARPRELKEEIAVLYVIWDDVSRGSDIVTKEITPTEFGCDLEISAGIRPHVIFGPKHRVDYIPSVFEVKSKTTGLTRMHSEGKITFVKPFRRPIETEFEMVEG